MSHSIDWANVRHRSEWMNEWRHEEKKNRRRHRHRRHWSLPIVLIIANECNFLLFLTNWSRKVANICPSVHIMIICIWPHLQSALWSAAVCHLPLDISFSIGWPSPFRSVLSFFSIDLLLLEPFDFNEIDRHPMFDWLIHSYSFFIFFLFIHLDDDIDHFMIEPFGYKIETSPCLAECLQPFSCRQEWPKGPQSLQGTQEIND